MYRSLTSTSANTKHSITIKSKKMKKTMLVAIAGFAMLFGAISCDKGPLAPGTPTPPENVQKVTLKQAPNIDLELVAVSSFSKSTSFELRVADNVIETFQIDRQAKKNWHLGKLPAGKYRIILKADNSEDRISASFFRYTVSDGSESHSLSPTATTTSSVAFDLVVEP